MLRSVGRFFLMAGLVARLSAGEAASHPETGAARPNHIIADLGLELIWVAPGTFTMGSLQEEPERNKAEGPRTRVTLSHGFWLGRTEVTQAQYEAITGGNPSTFKAAGPNAPVEHVSWLDARAFCRKLNERERAAGRLPEGYAYTLPTEAQWEYAHRAGSTGAYPGEPDATSWYDQNSGGTTHPVAQKRANPWGFHDMAGNVIEWCLDWYGDYPGGSVTDPTGPTRGLLPHGARRELADGCAARPVRRALRRLGRPARLHDWISARVGSGAEGVSPRRGSGARPGGGSLNVGTRPHKKCLGHRARAARPRRVGKPKAGRDKPPCWPE